MSESKPGLLWPLRVIAAASLIGPAMLFAYASWGNYRSIQQRSGERIERALDVLQEHAQKALQTIERTIAETNQVLRGFADDEIRRGEEGFSRLLLVTRIWRAPARAGAGRAGSIKLCKTAGR